MSSDLETKCEVMDPADTKRIAAIVKSQFGEMKAEGLLEAVKGVPITAFKLEGNTTIDAIAFVGQDPNKVNAQVELGIPAGVDTFQDEENPDPPGANTHTLVTIQTEDGDSRLTIGDDPYYFNFVLEGNFYFGHIDANLVDGKSGGNDGSECMKAILSPSVEPRGITALLTPRKCIVVVFSGELMSSLRSQGIDHPLLAGEQSAFAIVQDVQAQQRAL